MINGTMTIRSVIEKYPETKGLFIAAGFNDIVEGVKFEKIASFLTLESVLKNSGKDPNLFLKALKEQVRASYNAIDITLIQTNRTDWDAIGVIPMAIHIQMLEAFEEFKTKLQNKKNLKFEGRMASAQEGSDWIKDAYGKVDDPCLLPDIFQGRGFDFFFSKTFQERFIETDIFQYLSTAKENTVLKGLGLQDPKGHYNVFSIIPAVIVVNKHALNGLAIPKTWEDLLSDQYKDAIAMPDCNADLPRAVLLTLYSRFGEKGVRKLAKNISQLLHPSQLVKKIRSSAKDVPAFSIMPYFFSQIVESMPGVSVIWLEDGTIVEPLYTLVKANSRHFKSDPEAVKAATEFFHGQKVASIFSRGHFPALYHGIDNMLPPNVPLWWIGWDFIAKHDMVALAEKLHAVFDEELADSGSN